MTFDDPTDDPAQYGGHPSGEDVQLALDPRAELHSIAVALRGYVEWHDLTGTSGFPREPRPAPRIVPTARMDAVEAGASEHAPESARTEPEPERPRAPAPRTELGFNPEQMMADAMAEPVAERPGAEGSPSSAPEPVARTKVGPRALDVIAQEVASCMRCELATTRQHTVFARGNPSASLVFVGEAPGAEEDASGIPFVGNAGKLLDRMITAMGLDVERDVYVCNIVKCRPPDNRRPTPEETATCKPYFEEQLAAVGPRVIVALGNTAVAALLGTTLGITKLRGQWKLYQGTTLLMPTYHPSFLLRPGPTLQEAKREAWNDLQAVMKELGLKPR